ncbi:MAG: hypothetical protein RLZZ210_1690 [Pseudomonadota bacterium]|jgi:outer membrane protein assembly factor BamC
MSIKYIYLLSSILFIGGCTSVNNLTEGDKINYKHGLSTTSPLEIPPQINKQEINASYVAPDSQTFVKFIEQRNNQNKVLSSVPDARIERDGQRRWLVVNKPANEIWPKLEKFWSDLGFKLEYNSPETGIMETNWLENKANAPNDAFRQLLSKIIEFAFSSEKKDKFRTRIENNNGVTEIYVTHQGVEEQFSDKSKDSTKFYKREAEPEIEAEILRKMMLSLGLNEQQANYLSQEFKKDDNKSTKTDKSATAIKTDALEKLVFDNPTDIVWRAVGISLDRASFTMESKSLASLEYKVRYLDPEQFNKQPGFWARMTKGQKIEEFRKSKIYTVKIQTEQNKSVVTVLDTNGQNNSEASKKILSVIQENL